MKLMNLADNTTILLSRHGSTVNNKILNSICTLKATGFV